MDRWTTVLLGPELYWLVVSLALYLLGLRNVPATEAGSRTLERLLWLLPLVFLFWPVFVISFPPSVVAAASHQRGHDDRVACCSLGPCVLP